jgi:CHAT domain-containing protein/thioredoxin-like negative regulator of GroEL
MINDNDSLEFSKEACLTEKDLYIYVSGQGDPERISSVEAHLTRCSVCRQNLAGLLELLHPDAEHVMMEGSEPSDEELSKSIAVIQEVSRKENAPKKRRSRWLQWPVAAAAAICFVALSSWGIKYLYEKDKSEAFFFQGKAILEKNYTGTSPSNLRLALPFISTSTNRSDVGADSLRDAENLFFQALAVRENMIEAHLGLAYIYLDESKFTHAQNEFQKILNIRKGDIQALVGHGIAQYEEATQDSDPVQRNTLLTGALSDFNKALEVDPDSSEARYNKIWTLFQSGLHKEALQEIEQYLSRDPSSTWAEKLKGLKVRMQATQTSVVEEEVSKFAHERNRVALCELARQAPYRIPAAIWYAMRRSLELEQTSVKYEGPSSEDLLWAAQTMESAYGVSTGDHSFRAFIDFYVGLSPAQRAIKKSLDRKFQSFVRLYQNGEFELALRGSIPLAYEYAKLRDPWQLVNLHDLRGHALYLGKADFGAAESEFRKMSEIADQLNTPDLIAKALSDLAVVYGEQRKFDQSLASAKRLKNLGRKYRLDLWQAAACITIGKQYRGLGQYQLALREYANALSLSYPLLDGVKILEALEDSGIVLDRLSHLEEARACYRLAIEQQDSFLKNQVVQPTSELTLRRLNLLFKQGDLSLRIGDLDGAESLFQESLKLSSLGMRELEGRNRIGLAEIYLGTNRLCEAEDMLESAMAIGASGPYDEIEWKTKFLKGRLLERTGNRQKALLMLQQAIEILENMRRHVKSDDLRQSFLADRFDPFKAIVSLLYKSGGDEIKTLEFVDRAKSMTLKEHLRLQDLASESPRNPILLDGKNNSYPIVEYFFTNDGLLIFLTSHRHTEAVFQGISGEELFQHIQDYLESIRRRDLKIFFKMARQLYDELIAPIEKHAFNDSSEILVILPDGPLHLLPFAGLQDPHGRFLIEKTAMAFAPSRTVFMHCLNSRQSRAFEKSGIALIDGTAKLPSAREELVYLSKLYGRNASILEPGGLPLFKQAVAHSEIIHFSGHAINMQGKPALLLQNSPTEIYLDCQEINRWKLSRAYLVNLAGCSTGIGPLSEGEAPWGLIPAFLNAGAPAIIASLMPVDDASTKCLSCRFYDLLKKGASKAKALQGAQLALLGSARSTSDIKPQSWIPYILIGDPQ